MPTPVSSPDCRKPWPAGQRGIVLLLIVLSMLAIGGAVLLTGIVGGSSVERRIVEGASADQRLLIARDALLGWAVGNIADTERPGRLPVPDTLQNSNYDGKSDTGCLDGAAVATNGLPALTTSSANYRCIGRIPWSVLGITQDGIDEYDVSGLVPWYAVSANLAANNTCLNYLNPDTVAATPVSFVCPSMTAPPFPWLKVCDQTGKLLSDRVAFVLIMPGMPVTTVGRTQARTGSPRPQPKDYLDAIATPAGWSALPAAERCATYDNAALSNEFVTADATTTFNDRLMYVTVDDLMARVEQRVAQQVSAALINYGSAYGRYPWLAPVGNPTSIPDAFMTVSGTTAGLVPFHSTVSAQRFRTELNWSIGTTSTSDIVSPGISSSPSFLCFGGIYQCRLRTTAGLAIPRTVTTAQFQALKVSSVATPSLQCAYSSMNQLDCDAYSYSQTQAVSYLVQRRTCCSGTYSNYGTYVGTQTRTITIAPSGIQASGGTAFASDGSGFVRRSLTTASMSGTGLLGAVDRWSPTGSGAPFDLSSSMQTGSASSSGSGVMAMSNVRVYSPMPAWYVNEKWNEFIYAALSPDASPAVGGTACSANCFTAGARTGLNAVVISAGKSLAGQNRYTAGTTVADFIEAPNATGTSTRTFADPHTAMTAVYADTVSTIPR